MNREQFVSNMKTSIRDGSAKELIECFESPPGRSPSKKTRRLSAWYHSLSLEQKEELEEVINDVLDYAIFGVFCVLDGVRAIANPDDRWECELYAVNEEGERVFLNDPEAEQEMLHDIYQGLTWSAD